MSSRAYRRRISATCSDVSRDRRALVSISRLSVIWSPPGQLRDLATEDAVLAFELLHPSEYRLIKLLPSHHECQPLALVHLHTHRSVREGVRRHSPSPGRVKGNPSRTTTSKPDEARMPLSSSSVQTLSPGRRHHLPPIPNASTV